MESLPDGSYDVIVRSSVPVEFEVVGGLYDGTEWCTDQGANYALTEGRHTITVTAGAIEWDRGGISTHLLDGEHLLRVISVGESVVCVVVGGPQDGTRLVARDLHAITHVGLWRIRVEGGQWRSLKPEA